MTAPAQAAPAVPGGAAPLRFRSKKPFTMMPPIAAADPDLSHMAVRLLLGLWSQVNEGNVCWASQATLAEVSHLQRQNVQRYLQELLDRHYILKLAREAGENPRAPARYKLLTDADLVAHMPLCEACRSLRWRHLLPTSDPVSLPPPEASLASPRGIPSLPQRHNKEDSSRQADVDETEVTTSPPAGRAAPKPKAKAKPPKPKPAKADTAAPKRPLPEDFRPTEAMIAEAQSYGVEEAGHGLTRAQVLRETQRFKNSALAHARRYSDWPRAWANWMEAAAPGGRYPREPDGGQGPNGRASQEPPEPEDPTAWVAAQAHLPYDQVKW